MRGLIWTVAVLTLAGLSQETKSFRIIYNELQIVYMDSTCNLTLIIDISTFLIDNNKDNVVHTAVP